jgi:hypothetical protein
LSRIIPNIPTNGGQYPIEFEYNLGNKNWYNQNKKYLRRQGILYFEQLLDANLEHPLHWMHLNQLHIPRRRGRWHKDLIDHIETWKPQMLLQNTRAINPINRTPILTQNKANRNQAITLIKNLEPTIGKIQKQPNLNRSQEIVVRHFVRELHDEELSSVIIPCSGCDITNNSEKEHTNVSRDRNTKKPCLFQTDLKELAQLPISYAHHSSSNPRDKRKKFRTMISTKSNKTYLENQELYKEIHKKIKINAEYYLENILVINESFHNQITNVQSEINMFRTFEMHTDGSVIKRNSDNTGYKYHR